MPSPAEPSPADRPRGLARRALLAVPALVAAAGLAAPARAQPRIVTEEFMVPTGEAGIEVFLRSKRPEGAAPSPARTLLMVHGALFGASTSFDLPLVGVSWVDYVAARGFDVWTLDLRGFGRATRPAALSQPAASGAPVARGAEAMADLGAAVSHILRARGIERLALLGQDWGAGLAGRFAQENAGQVERLLLLAPAWLQAGVPAVQGAWRPLTQAQLREQILAQAPEARRAGLFPPGWFEHFAGLTWALDPDGVRQNPQVLRVPNGPAADAAEFWGAGRPFWDPAAVRAPTLVAAGEWSGAAEASLAIFNLLGQSPGKRMVLLGEGTRQMWLERNRGALFQAVQVFLEEAAG